MEMAKRIEDLTIELTQILSVVGTRDENRVVEKIYEKFKNINYFKENPQNLKYVDVIDDKLGRKSVLATINGKKESNNTIILLGHTDTVGISDYGPIKDSATDPMELVEKLKSVTLSKEVLEDLESGDYLFGRGIFDMKCGVATSMIIMEELSKVVDTLNGNIIFAAVCDEEGNSGGMLSIVPELISLQESNNYDYLGLIDLDYSAPRYAGDENRYVYIGTVGKLMPSFYIVGKETHVGEPYKGLDPNQISSEIVREFNLNINYCDVAEGEVSLPPITLRQQDLKEEYSVQIAKTAYVYFNYATHISTPDQVLKKLIKGCNLAFNRVLNDLNSQYEVYCKMNNYPYERLPWQPKVMTYEEIYAEVKREQGEKLDLFIQELSNEMLNDPNIDERLFSKRLVEEVHSLWTNKDPVVIIYFSPPYYPHVYVEGKSRKEKALIESVQDAIDKSNSRFNIMQKKFYPYISDLSYGAAPKEKKAIESLKDNMPGFGVKYNLPLEDMQKLNLPVVNIGPFGKDAHKFTERLERDYSFNTMPGIVLRTINNLFNNNK